MFIVGGGYECIEDSANQISSLQNKLSPFTYYSEEIENQFNTVSEILKNNETDKNVFFVEALRLGNLIRQNQKSINFGYDCLYISSFFLLLISIVLVLIKL